MPGTNYPLVKSESDRVWKRYCAFLDLSVEQFLSLQEALLLQQLEQAARSALWQKFIGRKIPRTVEEFRRLVPLTTYQDYLPELDPGIEGALPEKPYVWSHTSGAGSHRRVPYTRESYHRSLDSLMTVFILACSKHRGHSALAERDRVLFNVAPPPYFSGILANGASESFSLRPVIPPRLHDNLEFRQKVAKGFETSLRTGVDILIAMTSVLVKTGNDFRRLSKRSRLSQHLVHPGAVLRLGRAFLGSRLEGRGILPKDLWPVKALIGWGIDTAVYREQVYRDWGAYPYEFHACTEAGIMAVQSWTRKDMTFIPHSNFFEFIPENEWLKAKSDLFYQPGTVLLSEVKPGERYELVITSFYGMPFLRYRLGHLIRITALADEEAQVQLPQMTFETRADDLIDIAGFTRVSERAVSQALADSGLELEDWAVRKETDDGKPTLHLYLELARDYQQADLATVLHGELTKVDQGYRDLALMMEVRPLKVTVLPPGTFRDYYRTREEGGSELAQRRPPRMNASDDVIRELTRLGSQQEVHVG
ncbi:MAG: GH3 auxin-responsive promoter family protein [Chloroflexota bacterium]